MITDGQKLAQQTLDNRIIPGKEIKKSSSKKAYPETIYLNRKSKWENLFRGFYKLRGVTYVTSPSFLIDLYSNYDFEEVELIIGHGYMDGYKKQLEGNEAEINTLFSRVSDKTLTIFGTVPAQTPTIDPADNITSGGVALTDTVTVTVDF